MWGRCRPGSLRLPISLTAYEPVVYRTRRIRAKAVRLVADPGAVRRLGRPTSMLMTAGLDGACEGTVGGHQWKAQVPNLRQKLYHRPQQYDSQCSHHSPTRAPQHHRISIRVGRSSQHPVTRRTRQRGVGDDSAAIGTLCKGHAVLPGPENRCTTNAQAFSGCQSVKRPRHVKSLTRRRLPGYLPLRLSHPLRTLRVNLRIPEVP